MHKRTKTKLSRAKRDLWPGSIVTHCGGYNDTVVEVAMEGEGKNLYDFDITFSDGNSCSLIHCCTFPRKSKREIIEYFKAWGKDTAFNREMLSALHWKLVDAIKAGMDPFDDQGLLVPESNWTPLKKE